MSLGPNLPGLLPLETSLYIFAKCIFLPRHKTLRTPGNKLVINLALANLIMHAKSWVLIVNGFYGGPVLGELGEKRNEQEKHYVETFVLSKYPKF